MTFDNLYVLVKDPCFLFFKTLFGSSWLNEPINKRKAQMKSQVTKDFS